MSWFNQIKAPKINTDTKGKMPDGLWEKCPACGEFLFIADVEKNNDVCPLCDHHFKMNARKRVRMLVDEGSFREMDSNIVSADPLSFKDSKRYPERVKASIKVTGEKDAYIFGEAKIKGQPLSLGVFVFEFMGGSMGSVVGEKVARTFEVALEKKIPAAIICSSGGARMQEGIYSLMQLGKTSVALARLRQAGLPYISVCCDPTTGGVAASFAMQADVILAEPKALVGFAGPRVIEQTIREKLPEGFQRAEFLLEHGMVDCIVHRRELRDTLAGLINILTKGGKLSG